MTSLRLEDITVADRHRKDVGDITALAASIEAVGLLHPVVVDPNHRLVAGERRLAAVRELGWAEVSVTVVATIDDATKALIAERDENTCRKEMVFSELLPLKVAIEALERPKAMERVKAGKKIGPSSNLDEGRPARETRNIVAKALGKSATTMDKVQEVHDIANAVETPEPVRLVAQQMVAEMDRTGKVDGAHQVAIVAKESYALHAFLADDINLKRLELIKRYSAAVARQSKDLLTFDPETLAGAFDEDRWESFDHNWDHVKRWFDAVRAHRPKPGLRVMQGGK